MSTVFRCALLPVQPLLQRLNFANMAITVRIRLCEDSHGRSLSLVARHFYKRKVVNLATTEKVMSPPFSRFRHSHLYVYMY